MKRHSHSWKQSGSASLWRYAENQRNYPGWHFTADREGCLSVVALLDALAVDGETASRTLNLTAPTPDILAVPNNRSAAFIAPSKLRLSIQPTHAGWSFTQSSDVAELSIGTEWLPTLRESIAGIPSGKGDYSVGPRGGESLWLWWHPAAA